MTICEPVNKRNHIEQVIAHASEAIRTANKSFDEMASKPDADSKAVIAIARTFMELNEHQKLLLNYGVLLDGIMRQTPISWPPKCDPEK